MTPSPRQITPASATTPSGRAMVRDVGAGNALPAAIRRADGVRLRDQH